MESRVLLLGCEDLTEFSFTSQEEVKAPFPSPEPTPRHDNGSKGFYLRETCWGYDVIRSLDDDQPVRLVASLQREGVLPNDVVTAYGYGGYLWSPWAERMAGDTLLHLALRWKKKKALAGLYPLGLQRTFFDLHLPNAKGATAAELALQMFGCTLEEVWVAQKAEDEARTALEQQERQRVEATETQKKSLVLIGAHQRAREDLRLASRSMGVGREARSMQYRSRFFCDASRESNFVGEGGAVRHNALEDLLRRLRSGMTTEVMAKDLKYSPPIGLIGLESMLKTLPEIRLTHLILPNQRLGDRECAALSCEDGGISGCPSLTYVDLRSNQITDEGACHLAALLARSSPQTPSPLSTLSLAWNRIGDEGAMALAHAVDCNRALRRLIIQQNAPMTARGCMELRRSETERNVSSARRGATIVITTS